MYAARSASVIALALMIVAVSSSVRAQPGATEKVIRLVGHSESVEAVAVSPDGKLIATASCDNTVRLWDAATGKPLRVFSGQQAHSGQVLCVAFSPTGDLLATGGADNRAYIWEVPSTTAEKTFEVSGEGRAIVYAADGKTFAVAGKEGTVKVFPQGEAKGALELKGYTGSVVGAGHIGNGNIWATAGEDRAIRFWNGSDGKQSAILHTGPAELTGFAVRPDGGSLITVSSDGLMRYWQSTRPVSRVFPESKVAVTAFCSTQDGKYVLYATADKTLTLGTTNNNAAAGTFTDAKSDILSIALSPDGETIAAGLDDGSLLIWDRKGKLKAQVPAHTGGVSALMFHPYQPLLFTGGEDGVLKGWNLPIIQDREGKEQGPKQVKHEIKAHKEKITALAYHSSTDHVITGGGDKQIRVWNLAKPEKPVREIGPLAASPACLAITRDHLKLAAGVEKEVVFWQIADGKEAEKFTQSAKVLSISIHSDSSRLLIGRDDNQALLVDLKSSCVVQAYEHRGPVCGVALHPNMTSVITASADKSVVLSPISCTHVIPIGEGKAGLAISPGSERVVTIGPGKTVTSWNSGNGTKERSFEAGESATAAAISRDLQRIAIAGSDSTIRLYTIYDGKLGGSFQTDAPAFALAFHPRSNLIVGLLKDKENSAAVFNVGFTPGQPVPAEFGTRTQHHPHPAKAAAVVFSMEGNIFTAAEDKQVRMYRIASDVPVKSFAHPNLVGSVAFDPTGKTLVTGCHDGSLRTFDVAKGTPLRQITAHVSMTPQPVQHPIYAVQWSHDAKHIFSGSYDQSIKQWDASSGNLVREFKAAPPPVVETPKKDDQPPEVKKGAEPVGHRDQVFSIAVSADGKLLASASSDRCVKLWDAATGKVIRDFENPDLKPVLPDEPAPSHPGWVYSAKFTTDGKRLVTAGVAPKGKCYLAVWNVEDGKRLYGGEQDFGPIHSMAVLPDGKRLVIGFAGVPRNKIEPGAAILPLPVK